MARRHYSKESPEFAAAPKTADASFHPRFHLFYTEPEAEQDAYYWFMCGVQAQLEQSLAVIAGATKKGRAPQQHPDSTWDAGRAVRGGG